MNKVRDAVNLLAIAKDGSGTWRHVSTAVRLRVLAMGGYSLIHSMCDGSTAGKRSGCAILRAVMCVRLRLRIGHAIK
jgi:hypothetical protein